MQEDSRERNALGTREDSNADRAAVIIPTYDEARNIRILLERIRDLPGNVHAYVVDDGSPDGTADIVQAFVEKHPGAASLIDRKAELGPGNAYKRGFGTACKRGFRQALEDGYTCICEMDADLSHNPADLPRLIEPVRSGEVDMTVGSRYVGGIRVINWPLSRLILSCGAGMYTRLVTGLRIYDVTAGFLCYHRRVLEALDLDRVKSNGYSFLLEMKYRAYTKGFQILEIPIVFTERTEGTSKMNKSIVWEAVRKVWELRLRRMLGRL